MADIFTKEKRSHVMSLIKGKETKLEAKAWPLLKELGLNLRKYPKGIFGRPDAANKSKKIAVFIDGEFWHGRNWKKNKGRIKTNAKFWTEKIERNIRRDALVNRTLRKQGWKVIRIWETDLQKRRQDKTLEKLRKRLSD